MLFNVLNELENRLEFLEEKRSKLSADPSTNYETLRELDGKINKLSTLTDMFSAING